MTRFAKVCPAISRLLRATRNAARFGPNPKFFNNGCVTLTTGSVPVWVNLLDVEVLPDAVSRAVTPYCVPSGSFPINAPCNASVSFSVDAPKIRRLGTLIGKLPLGTQYGAGVL